MGRTQLNVRISSKNIGFGIRVRGDTFLGIFFYSIDDTTDVYGRYRRFLGMTVALCKKKHQLECRVLGRWIFFLYERL